MKPLKCILATVLLIATVSSLQAQSGAVQQGDQTVQPPPIQQTGQLLNWVPVPKENVPPGITSLSWPTHDTMFVGTVNGVARSVDRGLTWTLLPGSPVGGVSFLTGRQGCVTGGGQCSFTTDGGETWLPVQVPNAGANNQPIYLSTDTVVCLDRFGRHTYSTWDHGKNWNAGLTASSVCIAASPHGVLYCMGEMGQYPPGKDGPVLYKSTDVGKTWTRMYCELGFTTIESIVAYSDDSLIVTGGYGVVGLSTDGANTWSHIHTPVEGYDSDLVSISLQGNRAVIVGGYRLDGTRDFIVESTDRGQTWATNVNPAPDQFPILVKVYSDSEAIIASQGGVLLRAQGYLGSSSIPVGTQSNLTVQVYPNPTSQSVTFTYSLSTLQTVTLAISDISGRTVAMPLQSVSQYGAQSVPVQTSGLPTGTYYYQLTSQAYQATGSFSVIR